MKTEEELQYHQNIFLIPFLLVVVIWFVYILEIKFGLNFNKYGIDPKSLTGLQGIVFSPFIHADTKHLFNNSIPLFVLATGLFYFYKKVAVKVLLLGGFFTGLLTWIIATKSYHIGASGIVYLLFSFIFFSGIFKKHYRLVAMSFITIFLYGSMVWFILPIKEGMSWQGHLSGFLVGVILAFVYRKYGIVEGKFQFSKTEFDNHFDDNGNYVPPTILEEATNEFEQPRRVQIKYFYNEEE